VGLYDHVGMPHCTQALQGKPPERAVIVMTGFGNMKSAITAIRAGSSRMRKVSRQRPFEQASSGTLLLDEIGEMALGIDRRTLYRKLDGYDAARPRQRATSSESDKRAAGATTSS
jgi:DNA-binding NtrC family response regulator